MMKPALVAENSSQRRFHLPVLSRGCGEVFSSATSIRAERYEVCPICPRVKLLSRNSMLDLRQTLRRYSAALLVLASACTSATSITGISGPIPPSSLTPRQTAFLDTLERRTFNWFWDQTNPNTGLTPDRWPTQSFSSVAAIGFSLPKGGWGLLRSKAQTFPGKSATQRWLSGVTKMPLGPIPSMGPQAPPPRPLKPGVMRPRKRSFWASKTSTAAFPDSAR